MQEENGKCNCILRLALDSMAPVLSQHFSTLRSYRNGTSCAPLKFTQFGMFFLCNKKWFRMDCAKLHLCHEFAWNSENGCHHFTESKSFIMMMPYYANLMNFHFSFSVSFEAVDFDSRNAKAIPAKRIHGRNESGWSPRFGQLRQLFQSTVTS